MYELKNLLFTLAVGTFVIISFLTFFLLLSKNGWKDIKNKFPDMKSPLLGLCIYAAVLTAGVMAENITKTFINEDAPNQIAQYFFSSEKQLRCKALINGKIKGKEEYKTNSLLINIFDDKSNIYNKYFKDTDSLNLIYRYIQNRDDILPKDLYDILRKNCNSIYYVAKNRVYMEENYFHELNEKVLKCEFGRSMMICAFGFMLLSLILLLTIYLFKSILFLCQDSKWVQRSSLIIKVTYWDKQKIWLLRSALFFGLVFGFSKWGYNQVQHDYYRHIFGYFHSIEYRENNS